MDSEYEGINTNKIVTHWIETSDEDFDTMIHLINTQSYAWALFIGHISTEKLLKALYVKKFNKHAPFTHNLFRLGELTEIEMNDEISDWLDQITSFNINARYDDYKREFYKLCTHEFANLWTLRIIEIRTWIKSQL